MAHPHGGAIPEVFDSACCSEPKGLLGTPDEDFARIAAGACSSSARPWRILRIARRGARPGAEGQRFDAVWLGEAPARRAE